MTTEIPAAALERILAYCLVVELAPLVHGEGVPLTAEITCGPGRLSAAIQMDVTDVSEGRRGALDDRALARDLGSRRLQRGPGDVVSALWDDTGLHSHGKILTDILRDHQQEARAHLAHWSRADLRALARAADRLSLLTRQEISRKAGPRDGW